MDFLNQIKNKAIIYSALGFILFFVILFLIRDYYVDYLWYESQNQTGVFWTNLTISYKFHLIGFFISLLFYLIFYFISNTNLKKIYPENTLTLTFRIIFISLAIFVSFFIHGSAFSYYGFDFLQWFYAKKMGIVDPILNTDISFYLLKLPFYDNIIKWFQVLIFFNLIYVLAMFYLPVQIANISGIYRKKDILIRFGLLAFILIGVLILTFAIQFYLKNYHLIIEGSSDVVSGASYIDIYAKIPIYKILSFISLLIGIFLILGYIFRNWKIPALLLITFIVIYFIGIVIYPNILLNFKVKPNEFSAEKEFIEYDLKYTRLGYQLNKIKKSTIDFKKHLDYQAIKENQDIIKNIRLWDYRPIKETIKQLQEIRLYYEFHDVDIDRYKINGIPRQVLVSARELNIEELPEQAKQWIPLHLQYTHGYGIVMAPSNLVSSEGLPELWIKDFPPQKQIKDLPDIKRPEIYFGELTKHYVIVNTKFQEIDYPTEKGFAPIHYKGEGGIRIGSGLRKFIIALKFDTWKILISEYITPDSRIMIYRQIQEAVKKLAPFLVYDSDPYIVIGKDGKLYWILDAYTVSSNFPYSKKIDPYKILYYLDEDSDFSKISEMNYIHNSVKVIIDAYDGKIRFYQFEDDPILETYKNIYPGLILPKNQFPEFLLEHIRYPESLFFIQSVLYTDYHMDDAKTFYTREDRWQISREIVYGKETIVEPYYSILKLTPDSKNLETVLMIPFIPKNKQNLIAWMAARCDFHSQYGEIIVYEIPRTKQIYGPMQIESRIDQDPEISKDLTLWNQQGSNVIRGNLLTIPIKDSILYVEPIYLQASQSPFPELKRVIVATGTSLAMGENLEDALEKLFSQNIELQSNKEDLSKQSTHNRGYILLQKAKEELYKGNWKKFGEYMQQLEEILKNQSE
ncbi:MAG: UPF0182 protein [Leptospiraceae bacterium]|nr:MAG: UPF0182 protein [Leptospiraceae bacterium]